MCSIAQPDFLWVIAGNSGGGMKLFHAKTAKLRKAKLGRTAYSGGIKAISRG